jgi:uncharacterized membrane protein
MKFGFNKSRNDKLLKERGVSFYDAIEPIIKNGILLNFEHPDKKRYPNQKVMVININDYAYCVPYVIDNDTWFLKTIYPSRKDTKKFL